MTNIKLWTNDSHFSTQIILPDSFPMASLPFPLRCQRTSQNMPQTEHLRLFPSQLPLQTIFSTSVDGKNILVQVKNTGIFSNLFHISCIPFTFKIHQNPSNSHYSSARHLFQLPIKPHLNPTASNWSLCFPLGHPQSFLNKSAELVSHSVSQITSPSLFHTL